LDGECDGVGIEGILYAYGKGITVGFGAEDADIPAEGDHVSSSLGEGEPTAHFTVEEMDNLRVDKIRVRLDMT